MSTLSSLAGFRQTAHHAWTRLCRTSPGVIGLDIALDRINLAQFSFSSGAPELTAVASLPYTETRDELLNQSARLKSMLDRALNRHDFKGRRVVSCMPADELRFFPTTFALPDGMDEPSALAADLRQRWGAELDTLVVDYLPIRSEEARPSQRDALVVSAPRDRVMHHLRCLERAGLTIEALDIGPAALARLVMQTHRTNNGDSHPNTLVINSGRQNSHLSVVWGRRLTLDREVDFGEQSLLSRVTQALGVDARTAQRMLLDKGVFPQADATPQDSELARTLAEVLRPDFATLISEINKTLIYTASRSRGRSVDQIHLLGSLARYPGAADLLQAHLSIPVRVLNPFESFTCRVPDKTLQHLSPIAGMALACGLALRGRDLDA